LDRSQDKYIKVIKKKENIAEKLGLAGTNTIINNYRRSSYYKKTPCLKTNSMLASHKLKSRKFSNVGQRNTPLLTDVKKMCQEI
jgi:hypothetical protein